jgi:putative ABC transport system permease protein
LKLGSVLELTSPGGAFQLPIVGIIKDFSQQEGAIFVDRTVFSRYWKDDSVDVFRIYLRPGFTPERVKSAILARFSQDRRLFVLSSQDVKSYILGFVNQWFSMTYIQITIAVLVAILGIINTLAVSITDRKRELGVLRAIGGMPRQVRLAIWLEAIVIGTIGLVMGFALGAINLYYTLQMIRRLITGMPLTYQFPWQIAGWLVPIILGAALVAAVSPAEYSVRSNLVEALEYE